MLRIAALFACLAVAALPRPALASNCFAFVEGLPGVRYASLDDTLIALAPDEVSITYVGHSTFRIESPGGVVIATDFFGASGPGKLPDVVTMNKAHGTHYTSYPDPAIPHVLRGWNPEGGPAQHLLEVRDVTIRNVTTDIRGRRAIHTSSRQTIPCKSALRPGSTCNTIRAAVIRGSDGLTGPMWNSSQPSVLDAGWLAAVWRTFSSSSRSAASAKRNGMVSLCRAARSRRRRSRRRSKTVIASFVAALWRAGGARPRRMGRLSA